MTAPGHSFAAALAALLLSAPLQAAPAGTPPASPGTAASTGDAAAQAGPRAEALRALAAGVTAGDAQAILGARATLATILADRPDDASLYYWLAVADWRAVPLMSGDDKKPAARQCEAGLAAAEKAIELAPSDAEAIALRAGLQGLSLGFKNPMAAMSLGPKMEESMQKARTLGPENPRVLLLDAINTFHKPSFVGGGPKKAMEKLELARAAFEAEPITLEHWGHDDVYVWLGRAAMALDDWAGAEAWLKKALEVNPDHAWVNKGLLPKVRAQLAKQAG